MVSIGKLSLAITLLASVTVTASSCKKEPTFSVGDSAKPERMAGEFRVLPSAHGEELLFQADGFVVYKRGAKKIKGLYALNQTSLRFRLEDNTSGIYLREAFRPVEWRGLFGGEVRLLQRLSGAKNLDR